MTEVVENLGQVVIRACQCFGKAKAIRDDERDWSYRDLESKSHDIARALRRGGAKADEPVLVRVANRGQDIAAYVGTWQAEATVVPIAADAPRAVVESICDATGARFIVSGSVEMTGQKSREMTDVLEGAAIIIFTSGSTGQPKGVVLGHRAFARKLAAIDRELTFSRETNSLLPLRISFVFGVWVALLTIRNGGYLRMQERFDATLMWSALREQRFTDVALVPTMLRKLLALDIPANDSLSSVHSFPRILTGGEPFGGELWDQLRKKIPDCSVVDVYGLTETASSDFFHVHDPTRPFSPSLGKPCEGVTFRVADEGGNAISLGEIGELQIDTPYVMNGYINAPELTHDSFNGTYFKTGDLAFIGADGAPVLAGRAKELIVRGGAKISPLELDLLIAQHPSVASALTVGVPDPILGERIHVLVVTRPEATLDEGELRGWLADRVERFKRPDVFHFGKELPTSSNGKVDREALRRSVAASST